MSQQHSVISGYAQPELQGYHSHVYFDADTFEQAQALCLAAQATFPELVMGRMHQRPVGPHPDWSCQLAYAPALLNKVLPWLAVHRQGLTVFTHPISGDDLRDHRDYAIWMGSIRPLDLSIFK